MMDELIRQGRWSDAFFNFDDAVYPNDKSREEAEQDIRDAAASFLRLHPDCPYDAEWLVKDYFKRL
jgi:hypothetical protein